MGRQAIDDQVLQSIEETMEKGMFPQWVLSDPDIYELELERVFARTWQLLGHVSELPNPGDYVTRWLVDDAILLVRNRQGAIRAFLNSCTHRGARLCMSASGSKKAFTCPYHGFTFNLDGELIGIVSGDQVYGESMVKPEWNLRPLPKLAVYHGLIFGSLDHNAPPLEDYLGDAKWYLDIFLTRSDNGMEVLGVPQRWVAPANWKMVAENFVDAYHAQYSHKSTIEVGITPRDPSRTGTGYNVVCGGGHGIVLIVKDGVPKYQNLPSSMWPMFERNLSKGQLEVFSRTALILGTIFPNFSFNCPLHARDGKLYNYLTLRVWRPLGPEKIEVISWCLVDKDAPEEHKQNAYKAYIGAFGASGTLEQDDVEIWSRVIEVSRGRMVRDKNLSYNNLLNYLMGIDHISPDPDFPGPGVAYPRTYTDHLTRGFHEQWLRLMKQGDGGGGIR